jgi:hypothetical protein
VHQVGDVQPAQLVGRVPEQRTHRRVGLDDPAVDVGHPDAHRGALEQRPEPGLAVGQCPLDVAVGGDDRPGQPLLLHERAVAQRRRVAGRDPRVHPRQPLGPARARHRTGPRRVAQHRERRPEHVRVRASRVGEGGADGLGRRAVERLGVQGVDEPDGEVVQQRAQFGVAQRDEPDPLDGLGPLGGVAGEGRVAERRRGRRAGVERYRVERRRRNRSRRGASALASLRPRNHVVVNRRPRPHYP